MHERHTSSKCAMGFASKRPSPSDLINELHGRRVHILFDRYFASSHTFDDAPQIDRALFEEFQCVPSITAKRRRAPILRSTHKASRPLERISLGISGLVAQSLGCSFLSIVFLNSFSEKPDVFTIKPKSKLRKLISLDFTCCGKPPSP